MRIYVIIIHLILYFVRGKRNKAHRSKRKKNQMDNIQTVKSSSYTVSVGNSCLKSLPNFINESNYSTAFILVDNNTAKFCLDLLLNGCSQSKSITKAAIIQISDGEQNKTMDAVIEITRKLSSHKADRNSLLINLGGGVLCDTGGFAASIYKRGIDFINIPTTLLSQVDASIGGKVGVDLDGMKNFLGVFNNPKAVFVLPEFLKTLNEREIKSGFAEILKHGLIADKNYWNTIKTSEALNDLSSIKQLIYRSIEIKNSIVMDDPQEQGKRKVLNFGHTIGHAIETYFLDTSKHLLHGEAIGIGMICEAWISVVKTDFKKEAFEEIKVSINNLFGHIDIKNIEINELIELMKNDKKNIDNNINFTLLEDIGNAKTDQNVSIELIKESIKYYSQITI